MGVRSPSHIRNHFHPSKFYIQLDNLHNVHIARSHAESMTATGTSAKPLSATFNVNQNDKKRRQQQQQRQQEQLDT